MITCLIVAALLAADTDADDRFDSENRANIGKTSKAGTPAKPSKPRAARPQRADKATAKEAISATDIQTIQGKKGETLQIRGKVFSVFVPQSKKVCILNFGQDHRKCFKAVIFERTFARFDGGLEGIRKTYAGKSVIVDGIIGEHENLPQVVINLPSQLQLSP